MLVEQGVVKEIKNNKAVVKVERSHVCKNCSQKGSCKLMLYESQDHMLIEVENSLNAKVGDRVELGISSSSFLKVVFLTYLLPVFLLIAGAYVGEGFGKEEGALIGAAISLTFWFIFLKRFEKSVKGKDSYKIRMTRIISR